MADNTVTYKIKLAGDANSVGQFESAMQKLGAEVEKVKDKSDKLKTSLINMNQAFQVVQNLNNSIQQVSGTIQTLTGFTRAQVEAETRLEQIMRNTMDATDAEVQSIKDLTAAQQQLGIVGDEVQLSGAQELATYLEKRESLEKLIPVMNDMVAQQYGFSATQESAAQIATMLGKVMEGQTSALSRYGYSFDEVQEKILKYGTESQRAAVLAEVVSASVGGVNEALAQTPQGRFQQVANEIGDIKEQIGAALQPFQVFFAQFAELGTAVLGLTNLGQAFNAVRVSIKAMELAQVSAAVKTKIMTVATTGLNTALKANPIGLIVTAIAALVAGLIYAYNNCEEFRDVVNRAWDAVKEFGEVIWAILGKAIEAMIAGFKAVVGWIKEFLNWLGDTKAVKWLKNFGAMVWDNIIKVFEFAVSGLRKVITWLKDFFGIKTSKDLSEDIKDVTDGVEGLGDAAKETKKSLDEIGETDWASIAAGLNAPGSGGGGSGGGGGKAQQKVLSQGQYGYEEQEIKKLREAMQGANMEEAQALNNRIMALERIIDLRNKEFETASIVANMDTSSLNKELAGPKIPTLAPTVTFESLLPQITEEMQTLKEGLEDTLSQPNVYKEAIDGLNGIGSIMRSLGGIVSETAAAWLEWGTNLVQSIAQAIPQLQALTAAERKKFSASAMAGAAGAGSSVAAIPIVGPILAVAAIASVVASMLAIPKFAEGTIAYGPTLGLFGEYAGASSNPEIVAPLSKLRDLLGDTAGGTVRFVISGQVLEGILDKRGKYNRRTR